MRYAQVLNGVAHWIFESGTVPEFAPNIEIVDITGESPEPQEQWVYQGGTTFVDPLSVMPLIALRILKCEQIRNDKTQESTADTTDANGTWHGPEFCRFILAEIQLAEFLGEPTALLLDATDQIRELTIADAKNTLAGLAATKRTLDIKLEGKEDDIRDAANNATVNAISW
jgi:hypothetical protein